MLIPISDFLKNEDNCTPDFVHAISSMQDGDTLLLDGKKYHFYPDGAFTKEYYISNNDSGLKPIALPLISKKNVTIDGCGADLIFHGNMMPLVIDECDGVTIKNLLWCTI